MKKKYIILIALMLLGLSSTFALAKDEGYYLSALAGVGLVDETKNRGDSGSFNMDFDPGLAAAVALGYDFGESHPMIGKGRLELELGYRSNPVDEADFLEGKAEGDGDLTVVSLMINSFGETRDYLPWIPYGGIGIGAAYASLDQAEVAGVDLADDDDLVFAYQVGVGTGYQVSNSLVLDLGYRYFGVTDPEFTDAQGEDFEMRYSNHLFLAGLRYTF